jgi:hypothetical protein
MSSTYAIASPYYSTPTWGPFLDVWNPRTIPTDVSDVIYQIDPPYNLRPDLLAYDLYNDANLWWVFAVRNPNTLLDPVFDFTAPTIIYVPSKTTVNRALGI